MKAVPRNRFRYGFVGSATGSRSWRDDEGDAEASPFPHFAGLPRKHYPQNRICAGYKVLGLLGLLGMHVLFVASGVVLFSSSLERPPATSLSRYDFSDFSMGTLFRIVLYADDASQARSAAERAFSRIRELDSLLSDYRVDSEVSQLSRAEAGVPLPISPDLFRILTAALAWSERSHGLFDVTVGALTRLRREAKRQGVAPDPNEVEKARERVGYRNLILLRDSQAVVLERTGVQLDLGAIAKGYAADEALRLLSDAGLVRALVDAGGDIAVGEAPPGRNGWLVALAAPDGDSVAYREVGLRFEAVATSGERSAPPGDPPWESHILDPRTGHSRHGLLTVSVIAPDAMTADALATALSLMEPEAGIEWLESIPDAAAFITRVSQGETRVWTSHRFDLRYRSGGAQMGSEGSKLALDVPAAW